jgi:uncharacterized protein (DUF1778 family)
MAYKTKRINFRVSDQEHEKIKLYARLEKRTISNYCLITILNSIEKDDAL